MRLSSTLLLLLVAGCTSTPETSGLKSTSPRNPTGDGTAAVSTATREREDEPRRTFESSPPAPASGRSEQAERPRRAERERLIEAAAAEDRPAGGSEVRVERDGAAYQPNGGLMPHYSVRAVDKKDPPPPSDEILKHVPGTPIELPAPTPPATPPERPQDASQPTPSLLPRPAGQ